MDTSPPKTSQNKRMMIKMKTFSAQYEYIDAAYLCLFSGSTSTMRSMLNCESWAYDMVGS